MARLVINTKKKFTDIFRNIWEDVSTKGFMWEKTPLLRMSMA